MKLFSILCGLYLVHSEDDFYEYIPDIDPIISGRVLSAVSVKEQRRLGGVFGLCADGVYIPLHGGLVCDPPDSLPQICTLVCKKGYYSSGSSKDIACADAMCEGQCTSNKYDCVGNEMKFATRPCTITRYTQCADSDSQLCLEDITEECAYSFYEEVRRPCCNLTELNPPDGCLTSGCVGNCDAPSVFHYYSNSCPDICPPWRDPDVPQFSCSACSVPTLIENSEIIMSDTDGFGPPSQITVGCSSGFWGEQITSDCMSSDGSFYPPVNTIQCNKCSNYTTFEGEVFSSIPINDSVIEFRCNDGFIGDSTFTVCDSITGVWSRSDPPYCDLIVESSITASISPSASIGITPNFQESEEEPTQSPIPSQTPISSQTPSGTPSQTRTMTPSASKSPRPPKVKGSRAPTQPPKLRVK